MKTVPASFQQKTGPAQVVVQDHTTVGEPALADRYYLVTFDLVGSKGREAEYAQARSALQFLVGKANYKKIVMQCCIVRTDKYRAASIRDTLGQRLGTRTNILVVRLRHGYAFKLQSSRKREEAREFLHDIPEHG